MQTGRLRLTPWLVVSGHAMLLLVFACVFQLDVSERDAFSWMDPYQYYDFALAVLAGSEGITEFEVPSIYPWSLMPALLVSASIPAALWTNFAFTVALVACVHFLCREIRLETPPPIVALFVLSSPLLIGLSRTMYVEYALTPIVAMSMLAWLVFVRSELGTDSGVGGWGVCFAFLVGLGFMLKMTAPLFLVLPVGAVLAERLAAGRMREAGSILALTLLPIVLVLSIQAAFFPDSFGYYLSFGNTSVPIMRLIGPPDSGSWDSASFYVLEVGRTLTFLLTPLLVLALLRGLTRLRGLRANDLSRPTTMLWLWLIGPLLILILQPVKEPRHIAPCVLPAVLLGVLAIEGLPNRALRSASLAAAVLLALAQLGLITSGRMETAYYMDRPLHWEAIREVMAKASGGPSDRDAMNASQGLLWRYGQNIALDGFRANEALALAWQAFPGVVYDLEAFEDPERMSERIPYERFEDLYILTAFNAYNRRCGWTRYYGTLSRDRVVSNADFVLVGDADADEATRRYPDHVWLATIERAGGDIQVLRAGGTRTTPYRVLYAEEFLRRNPELEEEEVRVVASELLSAAVLARDDERAREILLRYPFLAESDFEARNIYWIGGYEQVTRAARIGMPLSVLR